MDGLWYRFKSLYNKKIKTGDPHCPVEVHCVKEFMRDIENKLDTAINVDNQELRIPDGILIGVTISKQVAATPSQELTIPDSELSMAMPCFSEKVVTFHQQRHPQNPAIDKFVDMMTAKTRQMSHLMLRRRNLNWNAFITR